MAAAPRAMGNSDGCGTVNGCACQGAYPVKEAIRRCDRLPRMGGPICGTNFAFPIGRLSVRLTPLPLDRKTRYAIGASLTSVRRYSVFRRCPVCHYALRLRQYRDQSHATPARITILARP